MRGSDLKPRHVDSPRISQRILGQPIGMHLELVCFEIHFRVEHDKLLFQALAVGAQKVVFAEVHLERVVVDVVLLLAAAALSPVADVTPLVLVSAVGVELVVSVEALSAETTLGMSLEPALVNGARVVVAKLLVLPQICRREELVLVREDLFVACAEVAAETESVDCTTPEAPMIHTTSSWNAPS